MNYACIGLWPGIAEILKSMRIRNISEITTVEKHSQLSNIIGHLCVSSGYFCSFIGQDNVVEILPHSVTHVLLCWNTNKCVSLLLQFIVLFSLFYFYSLFASNNNLDRQSLLML